MSVSLARYCVVLSLLVSPPACAKHVRMVSPDTTPAARYVCHKDKQCKPATSDVPAELNASGTTFIVLPRECAGKIHQIVVIDADSENPKVDVTCAPEETPIGVME